MKKWSFQKCPLQPENSLISLTPIIPTLSINPSLQRGLLIYTHNFVFQQIFIFLLRVIQFCPNFPHSHIFCYFFVVALAFPAVPFVALWHTFFSLCVCGYAWHNSVGCVCVYHPGYPLLSGHCTKKKRNATILQLLPPHVAATTASTALRKSL